MIIYVLGIEPFKIAEIYGVHSDKKIAQAQAEKLETNKNKLSCQRYVALTQTEVKKMQLKLYV